MVRTDSRDFSEWTREGGPKEYLSSFRRNLTVIAGGICQYAVRVGGFSVNLGGTTEVVSDLCPLVGAEVFLFINL